MRIGILTHRLVNNYGGVLQAYALTTYLNRCGHETVILDRVANRPLWKRLAHIIIDKYLNILKPKVANPYQIIEDFITHNINITYCIDSDFILKREISRRRIDAVIVGSDQVWRKSFALHYGYNYFLDFVPAGVKKISYAASFGLSNWEYSEEQTLKISRFLNDFDAISVREDNAVFLCKNFLQIDAMHVLDPTFLLSPEDYLPIISKKLIKEKYIFVYWLGDYSQLNEIISRYINDKKIKIVNINLRDSSEQISIGDWLSYIKYAEYVVTDSFHGCVFSIIFEKQFRIIMNESGGTERLKSLFRMLEIENEVSSNNFIDYNLVKNRLEYFRGQSFSFLSKYLG